MNVLDKIIELRNAKGWSEYQLAVESGMAQSTISSWYRKNMIPSIPSLEKICHAFGISLSQFFLENNTETVSLSPKQIELINAANRLTPEQLDSLITFLNTIHSIPQRTDTPVPTELILQ